MQGEQNWWDEAPIVDSAESVSSEADRWWEAAPLAGQESGSVEAADFAKELGAGALKGVGAIVSGVGDAVRPDPQGRSPIQTPNGEMLTLGDFVGKHVTDPIRRGLAGVVEGPASAVGDWLGDKGQAVSDTKSPAGIAALEGSTPQGDILKPSTWDMGESPSASGYGLHMAGLAGQFIPQAGAMLATRGKSIQTPAMMGVGGLQAGGAAGDEVMERLTAIPDAVLQEDSTLYRDLRQSLGEEEARQQLVVVARNAAFEGAAPVGALGGLATQIVLGPLQGAVGGSIGRRLAAGVAFDAPAEAAQEVTETVAARASTNKAIGEQRSLTEDTLADAVLGAMGGAGQASVGAAFGRSDRRQSEIDPEADATVEDTPDIPAPPAPHDAGQLPGVVAFEQAHAADQASAMTGMLEGEQQQGTSLQDGVDYSGNGLIVPRQSETLDGDIVRPALPGPDSIVVDADGNAQRGPVEPLVYEAPEPAPADGGGMDRQAPTEPRSETLARDNDILLRKNGQPFQGRGSARASIQYRQAMKDGKSPTVVRQKGGWGIAIPKSASVGMRPVDVKASEAAASPDNDLPMPTQAQIEAGNYKKGHVRVDGLDIAIENPRGSERSGTDPDGNQWRHTMSDHYGYIKRTKGADDEQVDVYIGPEEGVGRVFVVDQVNQADGSFDEHKVMIGYPDQEAAVAAYQSNFDENWKVGEVTEMPADQFKQWLKDGDTKQPLSAKQSQAKPVLQNRDRSTPASIAQMQSIAADPDYGRLGFSRDFASGAPVVEPGANIPAERMGRKDYAVTGNGRRVPVQYAVLEAADVLPSNNSDGTANDAYASGAPGQSRAIAGNGRVAGLQRAYQNKVAGDYMQSVMSDAELHGINPDAFQGMKQPVLVRVMPQEEVSQNIGDESNTTGTAALSGSEQAANDARRIDLDGMRFAEDGQITEETVRQFVRSMPKSEQAGLLDGSRPSRQAHDRLAGAIFASAYESDSLTRLQAQAADPEIRNVMSGLLRAAPKMARLKGAGDFDIRPLITEAAEVALNARRQNVPLAEFAEQADIQRSPEIEPILQTIADNSRSAKRIGEQLGAMADRAYAESVKPGSDMFGEAPKRTRADILAESSSEMPAFMRRNSRGAGRPLSVDEAQATVDAFLKKYKGANDVKVEIHDTAETLPSYRAERDAGANIRGEYQSRTDTVHLVAGGFRILGGKSQIEAALREEILVHKGLGFFSPVARRQLYAQIQQAAAETPSIQQLWDKTVTDYKPVAEQSRLTEEQANRLYAEELLGTLAQRKINWLTKGWNRLLRAIKRLAVSRGFMKESAGTAEVIQTVEVIADAFARGQRARRRDFSRDIRGVDAEPDLPALSRESAKPDKPKQGRLAVGESTPTPSRPEQDRLDTDTRQDGQSVELPKETQARKVQRLHQDSLNRFTVIKEWLAKRGVKLGEDADVYLAEERMHSRFANKAKDFREKTVRPLVERIRKAGHDMDEIAQYLHAQHAQERNKQIAKVNKAMPDGGSGMSNAEAQTILDAADSKMVELANEFRAITDNSRQVLLKSGLISQDQADAWQKAYQHYVPLKGGPDGDGAQAGTGKGLSAKHKTKRALGHDVREEGEWVIENIIGDHERALMAAEKNLVGQHLLKMALDVNLDAIMTIGKPEKRAVLHNRSSYEVLYKGRSVAAFDSMEAARTFQSLAPATLKGDSAAYSIRQTSDPSVAYMASPMPAPNEVLVYVNGSTVRIQINDPLLARAYNNMGAAAMGAFFNVGRALNRWLSAVYTGYSPEFFVKNVARDFTSGLANITGEEGATFAAQAAKNYFWAFGALLQYSFKGKADPWIGKYREDGGNTGAAWVSDLERLGADVQAEYDAYQGVMSSLRKGQLKRAGRAAMRRAFNVTLRHIESLNEAGENSMRLALYRTAVERGLTRNRAASLAKNTTVNFNRKGELGAQANALFLFYNAAVQGSAAITHAHFKGKHRGQAWGLSSAMAALAYSMSLLAAGADEDEYEKTPDWVKERNLVIPLGDGKQLTLPVPYGHGFFFTLGRGIAEGQRTGKVDGLGWKLASSFIGEFSPFGGVMAGDEPNVEQVLVGFTPTIFQPLSVTAVNRTTFGGPLMPESASKKFEPDRLKMWRGTQGTWADHLAGALEKVGMDVSPETLKHLLRTYAGGAGNFGSSVADAGLLTARGAEPEIREIPFLRGFYRETSVADARSRFWRYQAQARKATEEFDRAVDAGDRERIDAVVDESRELMAMDDVATSFIQAASAVRDDVQRIRLSDAPIAQQREQIRKIDQREAELYDRYIEIFKRNVPQ